MISIDMLELILGLSVGFGTGWICYRGRQIRRRQQAEEEIRSLKASLNTLQIEIARLSERNRMVEENHQSLQSELAQERQFNLSLHAELSRERTSRNHLEKRIEHQKTDLQELQHRLTHEFKTLVEEVLEQKSQTLTDLNQSNLHVLLQPISEKLQDFKQKIEEQHYRETRELIVLHNKLANLESGRWNRQNGTTGSAPIPLPIAVETAEADAEGYIQYSPEAQAEEQHVPGTAIVSRESLPVECGGSHTFTPKQQSEIDNFFKRIVSKGGRKKAGPDDSEGEE
jgi:hypothetical protein